MKLIKIILDESIKQKMNENHDTPTITLNSTVKMEMIGTISNKLNPLHISTTSIM
jgi:hypothetical protein